MFTATVSATDSVTVPAGTFRVFKVEVTGADAPFIFYVSRDTPRRIVKLDIVGAPVSFQLVK